MRITYKGANCFLALHTTHNCNCLTCSFFIQCENNRFKDDKDCGYAVIAMDEPEKVLDFQVCPAHQMSMNLIPWKDREEARFADMDMMIDGGQRGIRWVDSAIIDGAICQLTVEILPSPQEQFYQQQQQQQIYHQQYMQMNQIANV